MTGPFKMRTPGWMDQAACLGDDVAAAFPATSAEAWEFIRGNCDRCPVLDECAAYATKFKVEHGVWAGRLLGRDWEEKA